MRKPDVPGFIPGIGFVGTSSIDDADEVASSCMELAVFDERKKATFDFAAFGTKASIDADDETKARHARVFIVILIIVGVKRFFYKKPSVSLMFGKSVFLKSFACNDVTYWIS